MPRNKRKSKTNVQRLPHGERTEVGAKVAVAEAGSGAAGSVTVTRPPFQLRAPARVAQGRGTGPIVSDDVLAKVLLAAGPPAMMAAARVSVQWRRVALEVFGRLQSFDLGAVFRGRGGKGRGPVPSEAKLLGMLSALTALERLSLRSWLYSDCFPDVAGVVMKRFRSRCLRDLDVSGLPFTGNDLYRVLDGCPSLAFLRLVACPNVNDALLEGFAAVCAQRGKKLELVDVSSCPSVTPAGIKALLDRRVAKAVHANRCRRLDNLLWRPSHEPALDTLSLNECVDLTQFGVEGPRDFENINLSQCLHLHSLLLFAHDNTGAIIPRRIKQLNLAGCVALSSITVSRPRTGPLAGAPVAQVAELLPAWHQFQNLEKLLLFRARSLPNAVFSTVFGLSQEACSLPNLRTLRLNGCIRLETLRLVAYAHLELVDCSGCLNLQVIEVRECWQLQSLLLHNRKAPLTRVHISVPIGCEISGLRHDWHWESAASHQSVRWP